MWGKGGEKQGQKGARGREEADDPQGQGAVTPRGSMVSTLQSPLHAPLLFQNFLQLLLIPPISWPPLSF